MSMHNLVEVKQYALNDILEFVRVAAELGFADAILDELDLTDSVFSKSCTLLDEALEHGVLNEEVVV